MFYEEPDPIRAQAVIVAPNIMPIVANNPSKMTYHGTNTYIVDTPDGTVVIDPGPAEDSEHYNAVLEALGDNPAGILVSHHHSDHFGAAPALRAETGMPIYVFENFGDDAFEADGYLVDGDNIGGLTVLHTPGHASDHLCFNHPDQPADQPRSDKPAPEGGPQRQHDRYSPGGSWPGCGARHHAGIADRAALAPNPVRQSAGASDPDTGCSG